MALLEADSQKFQQAVSRIPGRVPEGSWRQLAVTEPNSLHSVSQVDTEYLFGWQQTNSSVKMIRSGMQFVLLGAALLLSYEAAKTAGLLSELSRNWAQAVIWSVREHSVTAEMALIVSIELLLAHLYFDSQLAQRRNRWVRLMKLLRTSSE